MNERIEAVQRMQDYIESHFKESITLAALSKVSLYSPWYSYRLFTQELCMTPTEYIRKIRLSKSALKLRDDNVKIIDVALEMGYSSVDGYQRAFSKEFGCNPHEYSKEPVPIYLFTPYGVKYRFTEREKNMESKEKIYVFMQVIEKPNRKVIIKRGKKADNYFDYCGEVGCDVWGLLRSMKSISDEPVSLWLPEKYRRAGTSEYVQGVEEPTDYDGPIPEGFDVVEMPKAKFLMFQGKPFREEDYCKAIDDIWNAEKEYDPSIIGYKWDDENPRIQLEPIGSRGYIELMPIKEK